MPRLVLDTNVVAAGLLWPGASAQLIKAAIESRVTLAISATLFAELTKILQRAKFATAISKQGVSIETLLDRYFTLCDLVVPAGINPTVHADPDDDHVLACALAAQADLIVSGDRHLLNLARFHGITIVNPATAIKIVSG
ncbi:MAG: putative toxin-antitoxin system toxin component, PIN family [Betaproteobacteria bacterium]|nr:putative toxin-antitoxin system toxin component, PIN family [Betaproteobacteria bacterium]